MVKIRYYRRTAAAPADVTEAPERVQLKDRDSTDEAPERVQMMDRDSTDRDQASEDNITAHTPDKTFKVMIKKTRRSHDPRPGKLTVDQDGKFTLVLDLKPNVHQFKDEKCTRATLDTRNATRGNPEMVFDSTSNTTWSTARRVITGGEGFKALKTYLANRDMLTKEFFLR